MIKTSSRDDFGWTFYTNQLIINNIFKSEINLLQMRIDDFKKTDPKKPISRIRNKLPKIVLNHSLIKKKI